MADRFVPRRPATAAATSTFTPAASCANYHPRVVATVDGDGGPGGSAATVTGYVASDMNAHWNRVRGVPFFRVLPLVNLVANSHTQFPLGNQGKFNLFEREKTAGNCVRG